MTLQGSWHYAQCMKLKQEGRGGTFSVRALSSKATAVCDMTHNSVMPLLCLLFCPLEAGRNSFSCFACVQLLHYQLNCLYSQSLSSLTSGIVPHPTRASEGAAVCCSHCQQGQTTEILTNAISQLQGEAVLMVYEASVTSTTLQNCRNNSGWRSLCND